MIKRIGKEDKDPNYTALFAKYNRAYKQDFFYECLLILYAMLEDWTTALFYYLGMTSKNRDTVVKKYKKDVRNLLFMNEEDIRYGFDSLSGKLKDTQKLLNYECLDKEMSAYAEEVVRIKDRYTKNALFEEAIVYLNTIWRRLRNEITYAMVNKDYNDLSYRLKPMIDEGLGSLRIIDNAIKNVKRQNVTKRFRIQ